MKNSVLTLSFAAIAFAFTSCGSNQQAAESTESGAATVSAEATSHGQSGVNDEFSKPDIVKVASGSKDHTTLVAAVKAAELVDALSNAGPLTVFAPVNAAFDKLPKGTVEGLLKPEKKGDLQNILQYHVTTSAWQTNMLTDGLVLGMVNGDKVTVTNKDGKIQVNGANIIASIPASNGMIHVIDAVLLPPAKK
ncbi:MAG: fasciclin domain-containing protein [Bacteroidia bacterium]